MNMKKQAPILPRAHVRRKPSFRAVIVLVAATSVAEWERIHHHENCSLRLAAARLEGQGVRDSELDRSFSSFQRLALIADLAEIKLRRM